MNSELSAQLSKIRSQSVSKAGHQQQHAAALIAVEETLKESNAQIEPSSYFAVLLTLLEQQAGVGSKGLANAILYLLSIILPFVSQTTLRAKFSTMMAILSQSLDLGSADVALLKSIISCLESMLAAQDANSWSQPISQGALKSLLTLTTDSKPKVRKRAQEAVSKLLSSPPPPASIHPASVVASHFVLEALSAAKTDMQSAMHTLQLVKQMGAAWPSGEFQQLCECLMQLPKLNSPYLTTLSFQALEAVFDGSVEVLDDDQFRDLLIAIIDLKPNASDSLTSEAWLNIIERGYVAYGRVSSESSFQFLPDLIDLILPDIELGRESTRETATRCLWALIRECIPDNMLESENIKQITKTIGNGLSYRYRESWALVFLLIAALVQRLGKFARPTMDEVLIEVSNMRMEPDFELKSEADAVLGAAVRAVGPEAFLELLPLNISVNKRKDAVGRAWLLPLMKSNIRNAPLSYFINTMIPLADDLSSQALTFMSQGREIESKVFNALSLQVWALFTGFCNVPGDIPESFTREFAERLEREMTESLDVRPIICNGLDTMLTAVHTLAQGNSFNAPMTQNQAVEAQKHLAPFASGFLSLLFNVFAQSPGANRGYLVETITAFLAVISKAEVNATFIKVCAMLDEALKTHTPPPTSELTERYLEQHPPPTAHTMLDLIIIMAPRVDRDRAGMLLKASSLLIKQAEDQILQKKGYKAMNRLAELDSSKAGRQAVDTVLSSELIPMMAESAENVSMSSRRERLMLISSLSRELSDDQLHFIPSMLSEVILGTKEVNERARNVAFSTLITMGNRMKQGGVIRMDAVEAGESGAIQQANIEEFFKMTAAGLAAQTPHMIAGTVSALSRALFEFHEQLDIAFVEEVLGTVLMFVVHDNREIAKASLGFIKVISVILPKDLLEKHLGDIVKSILKWSHEYKNQMRLKCRHIIERLVRRVGLDAVSKVTPEEHAKLIANIRKRHLRAKRNKEANASSGYKAEGASDEMHAKLGAMKGSTGDAYEDVLYGSEDELDDSDEETGAAKGKNTHSKKIKGNKSQKNANKTKSTTEAWIKEDVEGPLDFLDRTAFTHLVSANPSTKDRQSRKAKALPKMQSGKFVFDDPEAETAGKPGAKGGMQVDENGDDEAQGEDYYIQSIKSKDGFSRTQGNKIKFHKRKAGDDDDDVDMESDNEVSNSGKPRRAKSGGSTFGKEFRSKNAKGDVKRGNVDPYAYVPLNPKAMKGGGRISVKGNSKKDKRMRKKPRT